MEAATCAIRIEAAPLWARALEGVKRDPRLSGPAKWAWLWLATRPVDWAGLVTVTAREVGQDQGTSDASGRRCLECLAGAGLIEIVERERRAGAWRVRLVEPREPQGAPTIATGEPQRELFAPADEPMTTPAGGLRLAGAQADQSGYSLGEALGLAGPQGATAVDAAGATHPEPTRADSRRKRRDACARLTTDPSCAKQEQERSISQNKHKAPPENQATGVGVGPGVVRDKLAADPSSGGAVAGLRERLEAEAREAQAIAAGLVTRRAALGQVVAELVRICPDLDRSRAAEAAGWVLAGDLANEDLAACEASLKPYQGARAKVLRSTTPGGYFFGSLKRARARRLERRGD